MEKEPINFSYAKFVTKFRVGRKVTVTPDLLWRGSLWLLLLGVIAVLGFGYITYDWAISASESAQPTKVTRATLSLTELEGVISVYQKKQLTFNQLLRLPPKAPAYQKGKGVASPSALPGQPQDLPEPSLGQKIPDVNP
jgi:hypothetical protein